MAKPNPSEVELELGKAFLRHQELLGAHRWPSEHERWVELVFALVAAIGGADENDLRLTIGQLDDLDLLGLEDLAQMPLPTGSTNPAARAIVENLREAGLTPAHADLALITIREAAKGFADNFGGKVQKYLRHYAQQMLVELPKSFSFSQALPAQVNHAFVYWLQNVANLPLSLSTAATRGFCERLGITEEQLVRQADELDVNLALVDDIIAEDMA